MSRAIALALALLVATPAAAGERAGGGQDPGLREHAGETGRPVTHRVPAGVVVPDWADLTPGQQQSLASLSGRWDRLPAWRRVQALERLERRQRWEAMTPEQRERLRDGVRNFRDLPPELREKARASFRALRALPEDEREALQARWRALSPGQRRTWLEAGGPGLAPEPAAD